MDKIASYYYVMAQSDLWDDIADELEKLAAPATPETLRRRLAKVEKLVERGATEAEREAASAAADRLRARLAELEPTAVTPATSRTPATSGSMSPPRGPSNGPRVGTLSAEPPRRQIGAASASRQISGPTTRGEPPRLTARANKSGLLSGGPRKSSGAAATVPNAVVQTVEYVPKDSGTRKGMSTGLKAGIAGLTGLAGLGGAGMGLRRYVQGKQREAARLRRNKLLAAGAGLAGLTAAGGAYMANKNK